MHSAIRNFVCSFYLLVGKWNDIQNYDYIFQRNTFQLILATDCHSSYALFLYKLGAMLWNSAQTAPVYIGYTEDSNSFAYYENDGTIYR